MTIQELIDFIAYHKLDLDTKIIVIPERTKEDDIFEEKFKITDLIIKNLGSSVLCVSVHLDSKDKETLLKDLLREILEWTVYKHTPRAKKVKEALRE